MTHYITTTTPLIQLLRAFDAEALGDGDLVAGTNVLVAMGITLSNIHGPGCALACKDGERLEVGMSFAAVGGLTRSLTAERVLDPLGQLQNNIGDHVATFVAQEAAKVAAMPEPERLKTRPTTPSRPAEVSNIDQALNGLALCRDSSPFARLLGPCRAEGADDFLKTPAVFLDATTPADLTRQLVLTHRRLPYIRAVVTDDPDAKRLERLLLAVVRGTSLPGPAGPIHLRGHVAALCSAGMLGRAVEADEDGLLANLFWLTDGDACPLSLNEGAGDPRGPYPTRLHYRKVLQRAWAERLDYRPTESPTFQYDWQPQQRNWIDHLRRLEPRCPGLTLAARPLFGTLIYGLIKLSVHRNDEALSWTGTGAFELAKLLVGRMVQYRERLVQTERDAQLLELAIKLVPKLEKGPLDPRGIVRRTNRLLIEDCRDALRVLDRLGVARCVGEGSWELVLPTAQAVKKIRNPHYLDV